MTFSKLDSDLLVFVISKFLTSQSIKHLFCVNKGINSAFKEKEYSSYVWNLFWKREKKWHPGGQLEYDYIYKDNLKEGIQKGWYPEGQLEYECLYEDGQRI